MPPGHRMSIVQRDGDLVATEHVHVTQSVTSDDLERLPDELRTHVVVLESSMQITT